MVEVKKALNFIMDCVQENRNYLVIRDRDTGVLYYDKTDFDNIKDAQDSMNSTFLTVLSIVNIKKDDSGEM